MHLRTAVSLVAAGALLLAASGCAARTVAPAASGGRIIAVGAENQYTSVITQVGGRYVSATSVMSNPNTDPHTFEASAQVAAAVSSAGIVVQNGLGYDGFMSKIEDASPGTHRSVIVAQTVLGLPDDTRNPHLWYDPKTMPAVAGAVFAALSRIQPQHAKYFAANLQRFQTAVGTWTSKLAAFRSAHPDVPVAVTEPVADYMLVAAGTKNLTPWSLQSAIMNDTDPAPQDVSKQDVLFTNKRVKVFLYNRQVTDDITSSYLKAAKSSGIPVVGVYETMPAGYNYQGWMIAELNALTKAVVSGTSTERL